MAGSVFDATTLEGIEDEIRETYLADGRPWIIGFSGGKDSTCVVQLVWSALSKLPAAALAKRVYVISSDTLVEQPRIVETVTGQLEAMEKAAAGSPLPLETGLVRPALSDTFWVCLIGKGYPAPSNTIRWCTDRLKIRNANRFIEERVSEHGEVVVVLGSRRAESSTRAQVIDAHRLGGSNLSHHSTLAQAFVYMPIRDFADTDVWNYLLQNASPWGGDNRGLLAMYRSAKAGECPLVVDTKTASCGGGRFGCWVCTVVDRDRSMENMIDNGEDWMLPLLELRQMLKDTQDPARKAEFRDLKHRNGRLVFWNDRITRGPYTLKFRRDVLRALLEAQNAVRSGGPDPAITLIGEDEVREIQRIWRVEQGDWHNSALSLYRDVAGVDLEADGDDLGAFGGAEQSELEAACGLHGLPYPLVARALEAEASAQGMAKRHGIHGRIAALLDEEWADDMEAAAEDEAERRRQAGEI